MGEHTPRTTPHIKCIMTNKLMLAALFVAIAAASASDLEPTASDIVPESDFLSEEVGVGVGHFTKCTLGKDKGCAAPSIYTASKVCKGPRKVDCQYKKLWMNGKGYDTITMCSKWNKKNCDTWGGSFNHGAKVSLHGPRPKFCHEMTDQDSGVCRCAGKNNNWKGAGKPCFQGPNPPTTTVCRNHKKCKHASKYVKKCWIMAIKGSAYQPFTKVGRFCKKEVFKQGPWTPSEKIMGGCNDQGYAYARTCAYPKGVKRAAPPPPPKKCVCKVKGYNKSWTLNGKKAHQQFSWKKHGAKSRNRNMRSFHSISCTGCPLVKIHDNDGKRWKQDVHLGCCKGCKLVANKKHNGGFDGKKKADMWDLHNDVSAIDLWKTFKHGGKTYKC